jgi:prevent-host-death family protein
MKVSEAKPISYLKAHASEMVREISENQKTIAITQNGEVKVVVQDIKVYEEMQNTLAMLKLLAISEQNIRDGKHKPVDESFKEIRAEIKRRRDENI